ncbi:hypothetical protein HAX54_003968 [Datura stramonium]|uniref:Uncharacterized protein n=1 Tax=Datura stramonium TaxID=4076 RepID=A0ABS8T689_DATST|nr:hypothetical protein [Datura stramonium]
MLQVYYYSSISKSIIEDEHRKNVHLGSGFEKGLDLGIRVESRVPNLSRVFGLESASGPDSGSGLMYGSGVGSDFGSLGLDLKSGWDLQSQIETKS